MTDDRNDSPHKRERNDLSTGAAASIVIGTLLAITAASYLTHMGTHTTTPGSQQGTVESPSGTTGQGGEHSKNTK
jgi:hypothetical protein